MIEYIDSDIMDDGNVRFTFMKTGLIIFIPWHTIKTISNDIKEIEEKLLK